MGKNQRQLSLDQPATYTIQVQGLLDESWSDWFEGMLLTVKSGKDEPTVTVLKGVVADQAALQGMLRKLYSLGYVLLSVNLLSPQP